MKSGEQRHDKCELLYKAKCERKTLFTSVYISLRSKRSGTKRTKFWPRVLVFLPSGRAKNGARAKS